TVHLSFDVDWSKEVNPLLYPNNLFFGESATFHSCAPMPGTLTFQWHTFRGEGQTEPDIAQI
ncbi:hypothetical protein, partial [uncultured Desulfovibrio sp.]|uniref:hypothetical protein n=1 Tax=uncultured Desulfovibrio sp. TaxID=167968 RepID=UPI00260AED2D